MQNHGAGHSLLLQLGIWLAVCGGMFLVATNLDNIRSALASAMIAEMERRSPKTTTGKPPPSTTVRTEYETRGHQVQLRPDRIGHHMARIEINGRSLDAMVDTGATVVVLTYEDARRAGIHVEPQDFTRTSRTANGIARVAKFGGAPGIGFLS